MNCEKWRSRLDENEKWMSYLDAEFQRQQGATGTCAAWKCGVGKTSIFISFQAGPSPRAQNHLALANCDCQARQIC